MPLDGVNHIARISKRQTSHRGNSVGTVAQLRIVAEPVIIPFDYNAAPERYR
ncbi:MAG TPA: hypothetical protein VJT72_06505 [Pseudonocardiaceae bacterium]|nr:hypothetical protein [Pseudonocardiaceae bacterium]